jgi:hypothetical protein
MRNFQVTTVSLTKLSHTRTAVKTYLNYRLPGQWIGRGGSNHWPPTSPYLSTLDFYLWRHAKEPGV